LSKKIYEVSHAVESNETFKNELAHPCEEVISSNDADKMDQPSNIIDNQIDDFICV
jgi:hypothetical protein